MATTRTSSAGKASFGSWESEKREHPQGAPFFCALSSARRFCSPKGLLLSPHRAGGRLRGIFSFHGKRISPFDPQEKGLDWQSRARMTFVPPEWKCLRGGIASLAANGSARRFASAPIIRYRSAYLVGVQPNFRLPPVSTMRRAPAMPHPASSLPPCYRHSRLTIVRRG